MPTARLAAVACTSAVTLVLLASPALAHVTAHSTDATSGGHDAEITFRVPNEQDKASTVKVQIVLPPDKPFAGALAAPRAGWSVAVTTRTLATPIVTDDGPVKDAVDTITWTATAGGTGPHQFDQFAVAVGQLPTADSLTFKAIQTYSDGTVVRWIEVKAPGATKDPEHPAPTLALGPAAPDATPSGSAVPSASSPARPTVSASSSPTLASSTATSNSTPLAVAGLVVASLAALLALGAFLRAGRNNPA